MRVAPRASTRPATSSCSRIRTARCGTASAIAEAQGLIERALASRRVGPYLLQAAIAAVHAEAPSVGATDWAQIVALYDVLCRVDPSPVVALNRAAALGMRDGPEAGLAAVDAVLAQGGLDEYPLAHAARADMLRRLGLVDEARDVLPARARADAAARRAPLPREAARAGLVDFDTP